jgi:hypothetical protein
MARRGIEAVEMISRTISKLPCYASIVELSQAGSDLEAPSLRRCATPVSDDLEIDWRELYSAPRNPLENFGVLNQIDTLLGLPYFRRLLVFQELVLSRSLIMFSGTETTTWQTLRTILIWTALFREQLQGARRLRIVHHLDWHYLTLSSFNPYCS